MCNLMCNIRVKVSETPGASDDAVFQNTFVSMEFDPSAIDTMVDNWVNIEDEPGMLDCEVDEVIERSLNNKTDDESDSEEEGKLRLKRHCRSWGIKRRRQ